MSYIGKDTKRQLPNFPINANLRRHIKRRLADFRVEFSRSEGRPLSFSDVAKLISKKMSYGMSGPLIEGLLRDRQTNDAAVFHIALFLSEIYPGEGLDNFNPSYDPSLSFASTIRQCMVSLGDCTVDGAINAEITLFSNPIASHKLKAKITHHTDEISKCDVRLSPQGALWPDDEPQKIYGYLAKYKSKMIGLLRDMQSDGAILVKIRRGAADYSVNIWVLSRVDDLRTISVICHDAQQTP